MERYMLRPPPSCLGYDDDKEAMANGWGCGRVDDKAKEVPTVAEATKTAYKTTRFRTIALTKQQHDWKEELGIRLRPRVVGAGFELDKCGAGRRLRSESVILYLVGGSIAMLSLCLGTSKMNRRLMPMCNNKSSKMMERKSKVFERRGKFFCGCHFRKCDVAPSSLTIHDVPHT
jgi:hypothetical protein